MSKRVEFFHKLCTLQNRMILDGETPILDFVKRSTEEQQRLFALGKSKKDGVRTISKHQIGLAADIYLIIEEKLLEWPKDKALKYHTFWETLGGKPMISWDLGHFEM